MARAGRPRRAALVVEDRYSQIFTLDRVRPAVVLDGLAKRTRAGRMCPSCIARPGRWRGLARIHEGEDLLIVTPCTFGSDPLDRRMAALTDHALYLCAVPPKGAFVDRIPYAAITSVDNSRVTRVDIEREPGSPVTLKSISTQEFIHVLKGHLPPPEATWTSFRGFRS